MNRRSLLAAFPAMVTSSFAALASDTPSPDIRWALAILVAASVASGRLTPGAAAPAQQTCADFSTQQEAQAALDQNLDNFTLDPDGNGIACENLPRVAPTGSAAKVSDVDRIATLEALVAKQQAEIDALTSRVEALERQALTATPAQTRPSTGAANDLRGDILLFGPAEDWPGNGDPDFECQGQMVSDGYADIDEGLPITVRDQDGKVVGTGTLETGKTKRDAGGATACDFPFVINNLPDRDFYTISAGRRGEITYSEGDLKSKGWRVVLSLGN